MDKVSHGQAMAMIIASLNFVTDHWDIFDAESQEAITRLMPTASDKDLKSTDEMKAEFTWLLNRLFMASLPDILSEVLDRVDLTFVPASDRV